MSVRTDEPAGQEATPATKLALWLWTIATLPLWGFVFSKLWQWFVEPLGAPPVSLGIACGLGVLLAFVLYRYRHGPFTVEEAAVRVWAFVLVPAYALLLGYLVHVVSS